MTKDDPKRTSSRGLRGAEGWGRLSIPGPVRLPGFVASKHCQPSADLKAFKGKGGVPRVLDAQADVDSTHASMVALSALSREINNAPVFLSVHRRRATGQMSLRWRRTGVDARHVTWSALPAFVSGSPDEAWYIAADAAAQYLNEHEKVARSVLRLAELGRNLEHKASRTRQMGR